VFFVSICHFSAFSPHLRFWSCWAMVVGWRNWQEEPRRPDAPSRACAWQKIIHPITQCKRMLM